MQQHPGHPWIFLFQTLGGKAPALAAVVAQHDVSLGVHLLTRPHSRRTFAAAHHHAWRLTRQEMPLVRIAVQLGVRPRHPVLYAMPLFAAIIAAEKTTRRRNIVALFIPWIVFDVVHVHIGDSLAPVLPGLTAVAAK